MLGVKLYDALILKKKIVYYMRKKIYLLFTFFIGVWSLTAQVYPTLKVVGPELRKVDGSEVVLKGVNYNLLDDGAIYLTQNAQTYMN